MNQFQGTSHKKKKKKWRTRSWVVVWVRPPATVETLITEYHTYNNIATVCTTRYSFVRRQNGRKASASRELSLSPTPMGLSRRWTQHSVCFFSFFYIKSANSRLDFSCGVRPPSSFFHAHHVVAVLEAVRVWQLRLVARAHVQAMGFVRAFLPTHLGRNGYNRNNTVVASDRRTSAREIGGGNA